VVLSVKLQLSEMHSVLGVLSCWVHWEVKSFYHVLW